MVGDKRSFLSTEDLTGKISKTVFFTNFPDHITARDLWNVCTAYGKVVDVYIPLKRSKTGKKFAFVRFLKVDNMERLIENLCTIWIGRFHLHANPVRFQRESMASFVQPSKVKINTGPVKNSFVSVLKSNDHKGSSSSDSPAIVMDDSCIVDNDLSCSLMEKMLNHEGLASWFSELCIADPSFVNEDRLLWISIEDSSSSAKKICVVTKVHTIINQRIKIIVKGKIYWICVKELEAWAPEFNNEFCENSSSDKESMEDGDEQQAPKTGTESEDPFGIYSTLKRNNQKEKSKDARKSDPSYPPGFTPKDVMEDLIEIGHAMRYNMEGCSKNIEAIVDLQGVTSGLR
ncbi:RNA-directed DNA polymerase, eukaryota [Tanacetum coccineum]